MSYQVLFDFLSRVECNDLYDFIHSAVWENGRQETGYKKTPVPTTDERFASLISRSLQALNVPNNHGFDCWILCYPVGSFIPPHKDDAPFGSEHWRLNAVIENGAPFEINGRTFDFHERDAIIFRPDLWTHALAQVNKIRYVWSVGVLL